MGIWKIVIFFPKIFSFFFQVSSCLQKKNGGEWLAPLIRKYKHLISGFLKITFICVSVVYTLVKCTNICEVL